MKTQTLAIVQVGTDWCVVDQDGLRGEQQSYDDALRRAELLARRAQWQGLDVDVLVHRNSELHEHLSIRNSPPSQ